MRSQIGDGCPADLVDHSDLSHHDAEPPHADRMTEEPHCRRCGGDPVETVKYAKQRQAVERHVEGEGQVQQRYTAQSIIPKQQISVVISVAEPTRSGTADYGEDAGGSEQACGSDFGLRGNSYR
jgi:hypothetical protein